MKIFSRLLSRFSKDDTPSDHPFASYENVRALIADFDSSNSSRYLAEVKGWLNEIETVAVPELNSLDFRILKHPIDRSGHPTVMRPSRG